MRSVYFTLLLLWVLSPLPCLFGAVTPETQAANTQLILDSFLSKKQDRLLSREELMGLYEEFHSLEEGKRRRQLLQVVILLNQGFVYDRAIELRRKHRAPTVSEDEVALELNRVFVEKFEQWDPKEGELTTFLGTCFENAAYGFEIFRPVVTSVGGTTLRKFYRAKGILMQRLGRAPTNEEIFNEMGNPQADTRRGLLMRERAFDGDIIHIPQAFLEEAHLPEETLELLLGSLSSRERHIIEWIYLEGLTLRLVRNRLGLSKPKLLEEKEEVLHKMRMKAIELGFLEKEDFLDVRELLAEIQNIDHRRMLSEILAGTYDSKTYRATYNLSESTLNAHRQLAEAHFRRLLERTSDRCLRALGLETLKLFIAKSPAA